MKYIKRFNESGDFDNFREAFPLTDNPELDELFSTCEDLFQEYIDEYDLNTSSKYYYTARVLGKHNYDIKKKSDPNVEKPCVQISICSRDQQSLDPYFENIKNHIQKEFIPRINQIGYRTMHHVAVQDGKTIGGLYIYVYY
jgi:hypothetical protein